MSATRALLVATGLALAGLVALSVILRAIGVSAVALLQRTSGPLFYSIAGVLLFLAVVLVLHTPTSRKHERRVRLEAPVTKDRLVRPAASPASLPKTKGVHSDQPLVPRAPEPAQREVGAEPGSAPQDRETRASAPEQPRSETTVQAMTNGASQNTHTPTPGTNVPVPARSDPRVQHYQDALSPSRSGTGQISAPQTARRMRRQEELEDRLVILKQKADSVKVSFGLGRISSAGYRQYLKEVDQERMLIEAELMSLAE